MNDTIEVPEAEYTTEQSMVKIQDVEVGDRLGTENPSDTAYGAEVAAKKVGTKWVELRGHQGELLVRKEVGFEISVYREVETEESKTRRHRAMKNDAIRTSISKRQPQQATKKAMTEIEEVLTKGYAIDSFKMGALISAQAEDWVYDNLVHAMEHSVGEERDGVVLDELAVYEMFRAEMKERLVGSYDLNRGLSRSTSMVSNLMDDAQREAIAEFIRHGGRFWF